ncbi:DUF1579 family protein [Sphaerimonospora thailandensis]|uniref:DUF1579 domain-containing protein n=1 Tax=Sphaerimonospora thailandensis TaxID=795644 RepID=A0A8J3R3R3_9ACTN|nr:DUF1579 family protein [Sphaerimonospora thailandensis]GIH67793.1 hypothetical protein Mth01_00460 [Sphaerimonospora thailandensis]
MADEHGNPQHQAPEPNPALRSLDPLVGTWNMSGRDFGTGQALNGTMTFEWMDGGFFLIQRVEIDHIADRITGIEIIGHDDASQSLVSRYFDNTGNAFTYTWQVSGETLSIWFGEAGSPAGFKGKFSADGNTISGQWEWPGGGYEATMTRADA